MDAVLVLLVGFVGLISGLAASSGLSAKRLDEQEKNNKLRLREQRESLEASYEERLQSRLATLRSEYETQIQQLKAQAPGTGPAPISSPEIAPATLSAVTPDISEPQVTPQTDSSATAIEPAIEPAQPEESTKQPSSPPSPNTFSSSNYSGNLMGGADQLLPQANHPDRQVRLQLAERLHQQMQQVQQPHVIPTAIWSCLTQLSRDPDPQVRRQAILACTQIRSHKILPLLRRALKDPDAEVAKLGSLAIARFRPYRPSAPGPVKRKSHPHKSNTQTNPA